MIALRIAAALSLASAALLGGAWAGQGLELDAGAGLDARGREKEGSATRRAISTLAVRPPDGRSDAIAIGDALEVAGQPITLSSFSTFDLPSRVIAFYAEAFRARGLVPVVSESEAFAHVSVFDPSDGLQRFAGALPLPGGGALVLTGTADPRLAPQMLSGERTVSLPLPPEHRALLSFRSVDGGTRAETAQFLTPMPVARVESFYREALGKQGYAQSGSREGGVLTFAKPGVTFSLAAQDWKGSGTAAFVTRVDQGSR